MRAVWLNGGLVDPDAARIHIDSVAVRFGEGLFETMFASDGAVPWLGMHLARIQRSAEALGLAIAPLGELERATEAAITACGSAHQRVRLSAAPGLVLVEAAPSDAPTAGPLLAHAAIVAHSWFPERAIGEHKTLSYAGYRLARRQAESDGATVALLADPRGWLGETDSGNLFAVFDEQIITPPVAGLLPGVARAVLREEGLAHEAQITPELLAGATELFMTNAVRGVTALTGPVGSSWSRESPGPLATRAHIALMRRR